MKPKYPHTHRLGFLIGAIDFCTAGLFLLFWMPFLRKEFESILGKKIQPYWVAYLIGIPTLFVYTLVWMANVCQDMGEKAKELGIEGKVTSWKHMFWWNVAGLLVIVGPAVATLRFFDTLNKVERKLNEIEASKSA